MSSPRVPAKSSGPKSTAQRTAREAVNRAVKAAQRPRANEAPKQNTKRASLEAKHVAAILQRGIADGELDIVSPEALQDLLAAACRLYAARRQAGQHLAPVAKNALSATDVMVTASGLLQAADIAVFELGMWQGMTGR
jgi:hypothetical protein